MSGQANATHPSQLTEEALDVLVQFINHGKPCCNPLSYAAWHGHLSLLEALLARAAQNKGLLPLLQRKDRLQGLLHAAVEGSQSECVALLLRTPGVDVNAKLYGRSALHCALTGYNALSDDRMACIALLLRAPGINAHDTDGSGYTPLMTALRLPVAPQQEGAQAGALVRVVQQLLAMPGLDINNKASNNKTALHVLLGAWHPKDMQQTQQARAACLQMLLSTPGIDASLPGPTTYFSSVHGTLKPNATPITVAIEEDLSECVSVLLQHGAAVTATDLTAAAATGNADCLRLLLGQGAFTSSDLNQAYGAAVHWEHDSCVRQLIAAGLPFEYWRADTAYVSRLVRTAMQQVEQERALPANVQRLIVELAQEGQQLERARAGGMGPRET